MKKTLLFVALSLAFMACHKPTQEEIEKRHRESNERVTQKFRKVEYEGHTYILYEVATPQYTRAGLTHDPACELCNP